MTRACNKCGVEKDLISSFYKDKNGRNGRKSICKQCSNKNRVKNYAENRGHQRQVKDAWNARNPESIKKTQKKKELRLRYGLTPSQYEELLSIQNGVCAICGNVCPSGKKLAVDHNHDTGFVRGLLCIKCNTAIGKLNDDPNMLRKALAYLEAGGVVGELA